MREGSSQSEGPFGPPSEVVVMITGGRDGDAVAVTLSAVQATTPCAVPIVIHGERSGVEAVEEADREITYVSERIEALPPSGAADIVVLEAGVLVPAGWLAVLTGIAHGGLDTATVSALCTDAALARSAHDLDGAASAVAAAALGLHPRLARPRGPCRYVRRTALELIEWAGPLTTEEHWGEFAGRCVQAGLSHRLADDLLVDGRRVPSLAPVADRDGEGAARAAGVARRALTGLIVLIDGRVNSERRDGTWVHVLELIAALGRSGRAEVRVIVPERGDPDLSARLEAMPGVSPTTLSAARAAGVPADVVHRPFQVSAPADLAALAPLAARLLITHQDLISFHNPSYFPSPEAWTGYRELTRQALAVADHVAFFSDHVRSGALAEDLVEPRRATVVPIGVDHSVSTDAAPGAVPAAARRFETSEKLLVCLGTDFRHKNRLFALRIVDELQRRHDFTGWLLLAGPRVAYGSSYPEEAAFLATHPRVAERVLDLGPVSGSEREWLLTRADLMLYPTVEEGFGLVPFEAAQRGTPCLWAAGSALREVLPREIAPIVPWDAAATADRACAVLTDAGERAALIEAVNTAGERLRWAGTADRLLDLYDEVCREPPAPAGALERSGGLMHGELSEDAMRLVGPGGLLPRDVERPLLALASHRRVAGPVLGLLRAGYRASRALARRRGSPGPD